MDNRQARSARRSVILAAIHGLLDANQWHCSKCPLMCTMCACVFVADSVQECKQLYNVTCLRADGVSAAGVCVQFGPAARSSHSSRALS